MEHKSNPAGGQGASPASEATIQQLLIDSGLLLPAAYLNQLRRSDGGEWRLAIEPGWVSFWKAEDVVELNRSYKVAENIPGFFGFGSNGGGELLAFKVMESKPFPIYAVPFIVMAEREAALIAPEFEAFKQALVAL